MMSEILRFVTRCTKIIQKVRDKGGGVKILKYYVTSFMDEPLPFNVLV